MILRRLTVRGNSLFGVWISHKGFPVLLSLENYSKRIPAGHYPLKFQTSARFGPDCMTICAVPDRTGIRVHVANWPNELEGCVAPGLHLITQRSTDSMQDNAFGLGRSAAALKILRIYARGERFVTVEDIPDA